MKRIIALIATLASVVILIWLADVVSDRKAELEIMKPIPMMEKPPQDYPNNNKEIGKIEPGEKVKTLRIGYGKDFRAWKIEGSSGQVGWFIEGNDNIKIKNQNER